MNLTKLLVGRMRHRLLQVPAVGDVAPTKIGQYLDDPIVVLPWHEFVRTAEVPGSRKPPLRVRLIQHRESQIPQPIRTL